MRVLLVRCQRRRDGPTLPIAQVAQQQIVGIVPATRTSELVELLLSVDIKAIAKKRSPDFGEASPKIACRSPSVASDRFAPFPNIPHSVLAEIENDVAVLLSQDFSYQPVRLLQFLPALVFGDFVIRAPVILQEIEAPLDEALHIHFLVLV